MAGFEIEPQVLASSGAGLLTNSDQFLQQLQAFQSEIASFDGAWGSDMIGMLIGTAYQVVSEWAMDCLSAIGEDVIQAGQDLQTMATNFADAEEAVLGAFRGIGQALG
jgi:hypothetical protein